VNSLPKTVTRQRRDCDLNPGPTAPESSTLTTRLPIHPCIREYDKIICTAAMRAVAIIIVATRFRSLRRSTKLSLSAVVIKRDQHDIELRKRSGHS